MEIKNFTKKKFIFILLLILLSIIIICKINNYETSKNKAVERSILLINEKFSNSNINQDVIVVENKKQINIDSYTWLITYNNDINYDFYIRIGDVKTENIEKNECYAEFIYNNELDKIIAYNVLQSNTNRNPYNTIEE